MAGRSPDSHAKASESLNRYKEQIKVLTVDVTKQSEVEKAVNDIATQHGRIDFLFNNTGIGGTMPTVDATLEHWKAIINVNLWSVIYGINPALPVMRQQGGGHIINTASLAGLIPFPFQAFTVQPNTQW